MAVPRLAITPGEPAGIGPDVVLQAAMLDWPATLIAIADETLMRERAAALGLTLTFFHWEAGSSVQAHRPGVLPILPIDLATPCQPGQLDPNNAPYLLRTLREAIHGCERGRFDAMVTGPVQKSLISDAGIPFVGHTEFLAEETGTKQVVMMLATDTMRVALATTHLPLSKVPAAINKEALTRTLRILHQDLRDKFGIESPTIAVLGLNPHAGEDGHLGREEIDTINPVLESLREEGLQLLGPLPADTAFNPQILESSDAILAMFHDQGLPVLKYSGFGSAINITLGLPIIRTSVDHGTALSLAGTGKADAGSMQQAVRIASDMAASRTQS
ncbi:MAG: 4-hydroxythreonine-4-phosphate dehydrogenase PdxA [Pseudomonadota bacterium]